MAIFFSRAKIISRGNGQNALASAAYRSGQELHDRTEEKTHDYTRKGGILAQGLAAPEGAPDWMTDREKLWTAVEVQEKRRDAQLAREYIVAVPDGLTDKAPELTAELVGQLTSRGMVVDWSLHEPSKGGDDRNYHWHLMATMREIDGEGFAAKKARDWNKDQFYDGIKKEFCQTFNRELQARGMEPIDWRSYEQQGIIDRTPQEHLGPEKTAIARKEARELVRLERKIKANEIAREAHDGIGKDGRDRDGTSGTERGTGRASPDDRGKEIGTGKRDPSGVSSDIERTIHDIEDRARRGLTADEQRAEREHAADRERAKQLERERQENERRLERERGRGGFSR